MINTKYRTGVLSEREKWKRQEEDAEGPPSTETCYFSAGLKV